MAESTADEHKTPAAHVASEVVRHLTPLVTKGDPLLALWGKECSLPLQHRRLVRETLSRAQRERISVDINVEFATRAGRLNCLDVSVLKDRRAHAVALEVLMRRVAETMEPMIRLTQAPASRTGSASAPQVSAQATYCGEAGLQDVSGRLTQLLLACEGGKHSSCLAEVDATLGRMAYPVALAARVQHVETVGAQDLTHAAMGAMSRAIMRQVDVEDHRLQWETLQGMRRELAAAEAQHREARPAKPSVRPAAHPRAARDGFKAAVQQAAHAAKHESRQ